MTTLSIVCGCLLVLVALKDLFNTLFHPGSSGQVSDWISLRMWRLCRRFFPSHLEIAGPMIFAAVIGYWTASVVVGYTLIFRPFLPRDFAFAAGLDAASFDSYFGALNISLGGLITQSVGAIPKLSGLQFGATLEAVFGFAILTASISWILSIYPVLEHRRSLAHEAMLLHFGEATGARPLESLQDSELQTILMGLAAQLTTHRNELTQFPITYFFYESENKTALAAILPYMGELADRFAGREGAVRFAAVTLDGAVRDYVQVLEKDFLKRRFASKAEAAAAYANDHLREVVLTPNPESASRAA